MRREWKKIVLFSFFWIIFKKKKNNNNKLKGTTEPLQQREWEW